MHRWWCLNRGHIQYKLLIILLYYYFKCSISRLFREFLRAFSKTKTHSHRFLGGQLWDMNDEGMILKKLFRLIAILTWYYSCAHQMRAKFAFKYRSKKFVGAVCRFQNIDATYVATKSRLTLIAELCPVSGISNMPIQVRCNVQLNKSE